MECAKAINDESRLSQSAFYPFVATWTILYVLFEPLRRQRLVRQQASKRQRASILCLSQGMIRVVL